MPQFILSIKKIPIPLAAVELLFALILGMYLFFIQSFVLQQPYSESFARIIQTIQNKPSLLERVFIPHAPVKTVHIRYYQQKFDIETNVRTFGELFAFLPFIIEKKYAVELWQSELTDGMDIQIPPRLYEIGVASWYGSYFQGRPTASVEPYNMYALTAAHKTLPLGSRVKITNLANKKSIIVRINDRGPYVGERVIDLSFEAARKIGFAYHGLARVAVEFVD